MKRLASVSVLVAFTLGLSAWAGSHRANAGETHSSTAISRSSGLIFGGRIRCIATVRSEVQAGHDVSVKFRFRNVSKRPVKLYLGRGTAWLIVKAAEGTRYDTRVPERGLPVPAPIPTKISPGATKKAGRVEVAVRWKGPLRITPGCEQKGLPALHVAVASPGPPPDDSTAVSEVVAATGHLLDTCRPQTAGVAVDGEIDAPTSGAAPPMPARCSVSLDSKGSFWVAQVLVLIPPGLQGVTVQQPYEVFGPPYGLFSGSPLPPPPYEAIAWQVVVTRDGGLPVAATTADATNDSSTGQMAPSWRWNGTAWVASGTASCGFHGWQRGKYPTVDFISACPS